MSFDPNQEILTRRDNNSSSRFCLFPIQYEDIYQMYKKNESCFWVVDEIDFTQDIDDYERLSDSEKYFLENILGFFASSDNIVIERLLSSLSVEIQLPEVRLFYGFQCAIEGIHTQAYNLMIDTLIKDNKRKQELFNAIETIPCVKQKSDWAVKYIEQKLDKPESLAAKIFAFGIVEGLFFSSSFASIFYFKQRGKLLHGLAKSNEWISRDEGFHTEFAILLYSYVKNKLSKQDALDIMKEAVAIEEEFICESIPCDLIGMKKKEMKSYIRYVADRLMYSFGYELIYEAKNPYAFMEKNSLSGKTNFFESRVSEYRKASSSSINFDSSDSDGDF